MLDAIQISCALWGTIVCGTLVLMGNVAAGRRLSAVVPQLFEDEVVKA